MKIIFESNRITRPSGLGDGMKTIPGSLSGLIGDKCRVLLWFLQWNRMYFLFWQWHPLVDFGVGADGAVIPSDYMAGFGHGLECSNGSGIAGVL